MVYNRVTGALNLVHHLVGLRLALSKGANRVGVSPSSEDGNRSSFQNAVFSSFWNTGRWTKSKNPVTVSEIQ
jgi:hypothetical protein